MTSPRRILTGISETKTSTPSIEPKGLQMWLHDTGEFLTNELDFGSYESEIGMEKKLSVRNCNELIWADISKLKATLPNASLHGSSIIPPLTTIDIIYKIDKEKPGLGPSQLTKEASSPKWRGAMSGTISWYSVETLEAKHIVKTEHEK